MWARGAVFSVGRTRRWRATAGGHNVYINVGRLSRSDSESPDEREMLRADGWSRQGSGSVTRARKGVKHRHWQPRGPPAPPASADTAAVPTARTPRPSFSFLVSARAASCVHNTKNLLTVSSASCVAHLWLRFFFEFFMLTSSVPLTEEGLHAYCSCCWVIWAFLWACSVVRS